MKNICRNATAGLLVLNIIEAHNFFVYEEEWLVRYVSDTSGAMLTAALLFFFTGYVILTIKDLLHR